MKRALVLHSSYSFDDLGISVHQTFFINAVRVVNDISLTSLSDHLNYLFPKTPSGQHLSPNTPLGGYHHKTDFKRDFIYNTTLGLWLKWIKFCIPTLQGRINE